MRSDIVTKFMWQMCCQIAARASLNMDCWNWQLSDWSPLIGNILQLKLCDVLLGDMPITGKCCFIAHEFFDALPIHKFQVSQSICGHLSVFCADAVKWSSVSIDLCIQPQYSVGWLILTGTWVHLVGLLVCDGMMCFISARLSVSSSLPYRRYY